jgi:hypothetical protein
MHTIKAKTGQHLLSRFLFYAIATVLDDSDVLGLQAFLALRNGELYALSFFQIAVTITNDGIEVDEYIFATCTFNETVAFATIEPFDCTLFFLRHDLELLSS